MRIKSEMFFSVVLKALVGQSMLRTVDSHAALISRLGAVVWAKSWDANSNIKINFLIGNPMLLE